MSPKKSTDAQALRACVARHCPANAIALEPIPTGKFNASYFVRADGRELVLRVAPSRDTVFLFYERDMMRQEPGIHALLLEKTSVPVPPILAFDDSHAIIDRDYLLMERLPGRPLSEAWGIDGDRVLRQVGACLAQVHGLTAERYGYLGEHAPMEPQPMWIDAFAMMWRKLIEDIVGVGYYDREEAQGLLRLFDRHRAAFDRPVAASLLHMDVWAQNILVNGGGLSGLVDWDRALWGDPEIEFAVLDYCGVSEPAFWQGYGTGGRDPRETSPGAGVRRVFYLLYELQKYIVIRHGRNHDPASARAYKAQALHLAQQLASG